MLSTIHHPYIGDVSFMAPLSEYYLHKTKMNPIACMRCCSHQASGQSLTSKTMGFFHWIHASFFKLVVSAISDHNLTTCRSHTSSPNTCGYGKWLCCSWFSPIQESRGVLTVCLWNCSDLAFSQALSRFQNITWRYYSYPTIWKR
jgi:hypothetical protein